MASAGVCMAALTDEPSEAAADPTYGTSTDINIAPGMISGTPTTHKAQTSYTITANLNTVSVQSRSVLPHNLNIRLGRFWFSLQV